MTDRRVEALIRAAVDDVQPMVEALRANGWPTTVHIECSPELGRYEVQVQIQVLPASVEPMIPSREAGQ